MGVNLKGDWKIKPGKCRLNARVLRGVNIMWQYTWLNFVSRYNNALLQS